MDLNKDGRITLEEFRECFNESRFGKEDKNEKENEDDLSFQSSNDDDDEIDFQKMVQSLNVEKIVNQ